MNCWLLHNRSLSKGISFLQDELGHYKASPSQSQSYYGKIKEIYSAITWSCQQIQREEVTSPGCGIAALKRLRQYLSNVTKYPENVKYRRLRVCNPIFMRAIYNTGARGVLVALGFEEHCGYLECGAAEGLMLTQDRIKMISVRLNLTCVLLFETESAALTNVVLSLSGCDCNAFINDGETRESER